MAIKAIGFQDAAFLSSTTLETRTAPGIQGSPPEPVEASENPIFKGVQVKPRFGDPHLSATFAIRMSFISRECN
jgi:hypothetical protein